MTNEERKRNIEAVDVQIADLTRAPGPDDSIAVPFGRAWLAAELYARNEQAKMRLAQENTKA